MATIDREAVQATRPGTRFARATAEPPFVRWVLIAIALGFLALFLFLPLATLLLGALRYGVATYTGAVMHPEALSAIALSLKVAMIVVVLNTIFGVMAGWAIGTFHFRGKQLLVTLIDLPFAISPVISGFLFVLLFGRVGWFGPWLAERDLQVIFALPGVVLATLFVTFPFVARELIPLIEAQGCEEEQAAHVLGANGWQIFWRVTLPKIRWGLLYGILLTNARAMGEFGAVAVVSGHIRGLTTTMPLQIELLYNEYDFVAAFAVASLLLLLALATLVARSIVESRARKLSPDPGSRS